MLRIATGVFGPKQRCRASENSKLDSIDSCIDTVLDDPIEESVDSRHSCATLTFLVMTNRPTANLSGERYCFWI